MRQGFSWQIIISMGFVEGAPVFGEAPSVEDEFKLHVASVSESLTGWYEARHRKDFLSRSVLAMTAHDLYELITSPNYDGWQIKLNVGDQAAPAINFQGKDDDTGNIVVLEPDSEVILKQAEFRPTFPIVRPHTFLENKPSKELYVGDEERSFWLVSLALILGEGGRIEAVPAKTAE